MSGSIRYLVQEFDQAFCRTHCWQPRLCSPPSPVEEFQRSPSRLLTCPRLPPPTIAIRACPQSRPPSQAPAVAHIILARPSSSHAPTVVLATARARCPRSPRRLLPPVAPTVRARLPSTLACRLLPPVVPTARAHPPSAFARHRARRPHPRAAHTRPPSHSPTAYARLRLAHLFLLPRRSVRVREGREQIGSMR
jgi:hypothetical protein